MSTIPPLKFIEKKTMYLVGIGAFGNFHTNGQIPQLWQEFGVVLPTIPNRVNESQCFGVESYTDSFMPTKKWHYMTAVEVKDLNQVPSTALVKILPSNLYAVFTHRGKMDTVSQTFNYIYSTWLVTANYTIADSYDFEYYDERFKPGNEDSEMDIYIPVRAKK